MKRVKAPVSEKTGKQKAPVPDETGKLSSTLGIVLSTVSEDQSSQTNDIRTANDSNICDNHQTNNTAEAFELEAPVPTNIGTEKQQSTTAADVNNEVDLAKPTRSLNLICYRPGSQGCVLHQIRVIKESLFPSTKDFISLIEANPDLIQNDAEFFQSLWQE